MTTTQIDTGAPALAVAGVIVAAALVLGLAGRVVLGRIAARARTNRWTWDDAVWTFVHDVVLPIALGAGMWGATLTLDIPDAHRDLVARALAAGAAVVISLAVARLVGTLVASVARARAGVASSATIFVTIVRVTVLAIGLLFLLQSIGISITPLLTALGVGGLAVALALQDTLANLFAGVHILASGKVQQGDYVCLDSGEDGYIVDINWRNTSIRQLLGNVVIVPNAKFADAILTNYHRPEQEMNVPVEVGVSYDSDLREVERVTVDVATGVMEDVAGAVRTHQPFVRFVAFGESSVDLRVFLRTHEFTDQYLVVHEFIKRLHERFRAEGIEIPFPMRTVVMKEAGPAGGAAPAEASGLAGPPA